jgi:hypothetical protein
MRAGLIPKVQALFLLSYGIYRSWSFHVLRILCLWVKKKASVWNPPLSFRCLTMSTCIRARIPHSSVVTCNCICFRKKKTFRLLPVVRRMMAEQLINCSTSPNKTKKITQISKDVTESHSQFFVLVSNVFQPMEAPIVDPLSPAHSKLRLYKTIMTARIYQRRLNTSPSRMVWCCCWHGRGGGRWKRHVRTKLELSPD